MLERNNEVHLGQFNQASLVIRSIIDDETKQDKEKNTQSDITIILTRF